MSIATAHNRGFTRCLCDGLLLRILLGHFPSSGIAGMVLNIILTLCPVQYVSSSGNPTMSIPGISFDEPFRWFFCLPICLIPVTGACHVFFLVGLRAFFYGTFFLTGAVISSFLIVSFFVTLHTRSIYIQSLFLAVRGGP